jgi:hypothetical protein
MVSLMKSKNEKYCIIKLNSGDKQSLKNLIGYPRTHQQLTVTKQTGGDVHNAYRPIA